MAITSAQNFTVQDNTLFGNTSFIGARGPNCSDSDTVPTPAAFILDTNTTGSLSLQTGFEGIRDGDSLTCVLPPNGGDFWPFGSDPSPSNPSGAPTPTNPPRHKAVSGGGVAGIVIGCVLGLVSAAVVAWLIRRWMLKRRKARKAWYISKPLPSKF
jgi:hypothetical protein